MGRSEPGMVMCCFSGDWIPQESAVTIVAFIPNAKESQTLYARPGEIAKRVRPDVPLHPDL
ncbi:hypothetical protein [Frigidibacter sp.]|uniref:hypothetical protein n=1 Tax=Frigidibacter sp. TaxID=2586418 RepID=UPI0027354EC3|nr:hypothetical protein [Frigidibacter sp.]MDP3341196.1 hypothetical protein [Frigidibacter sp.]